MPPQFTATNALVLRSVVQAVNLARDHFLADSRLSGDQHRRRLPGEPRQHVLDALHSRRKPERRQPLVMGRFGNVRTQLGDKLVEVEGLGDVVGGPQLHERDRSLDGAVAGDEDPRRDIQLLALQLFEQVIAVAVGQPDVTDHDIVAFLFQVAGRCLRRSVPVAPESLQLETIDEGFAHDLVVLDEANLSQRWMPSCGDRQLDSEHGLTGFALRFDPAVQLGRQLVGHP